jgi:hypothetical protein
MSIEESVPTFLVVTNQVTETDDVQELPEGALPGLYLGVNDRGWISYVLSPLEGLGFQVMGTYSPVESAHYGGYNYPQGRLVVVNIGDTDPWEALAAINSAFSAAKTLSSIELMKE